MCNLCFDINNDKISTSNERRRKLREVEKLEFKLPDELYAREPREVLGQKRCDSKMLIGINGRDTYYNSHVMELADLLEEGDLVVLNNSKTISPIFKAFSLEFGLVEFHLSIQKDQYRWETILTVRDDLKRNIVGKEFRAIHDGPIVKVLNIVDETKYEIELSYNRENLIDYCLKHGKPVQSIYVNNDWGIEYYQNDIGKVYGSVENPAANRHFTKEVIEKLQENGINIAYITLHCAAINTYISENSFNEHIIGAEHYEIPIETVELIRETKAKGKKVVAVGTTVTRTLESAQYNEEYSIVSELNGETSLAIYPGYDFKVLDGIITNFHGSRSSRLALAGAAIGMENVMKMYEWAIMNNYTFYEFGDTTFLIINPDKFSFSDSNN